MITCFICAGTHYTVAIINILMVNHSLHFQSFTEHSNFVSCFLSRVYDLLAERDALTEDPESWAVNAALDGQKLQNNFTLVNTLSRLLGDVLKKLLCYIIPLIDKNSNLDRIDPEDEQSVLSQLWLSAFRNDTFFQLRYTSFTTSSSSTMEVSRQQYKCQFPFSWELIDQIDAVSTSLIPNTGLFCHSVLLSKTMGSEWLISYILHFAYFRWTECSWASYI